MLWEITNKTPPHKYSSTSYSATIFLTILLSFLADTCFRGSSLCYCLSSHRSHRLCFFYDHTAVKHKVSSAPRTSYLKQSVRNKHYFSPWSTYTSTLWLASHVQLHCVLKMVLNMAVLLYGLLLRKTNVYRKTSVCVYLVCIWCSNCWLTLGGFGINSDFELFGKGTKWYLRTHMVLIWGIQV